MARTWLSLLTILLLLALTVYAATIRSDPPEMDALPRQTAQAMRPRPPDRHLVGIAYPSGEEPFILSSFENLLPGDPDPLAEITGPISVLTAERWLIRGGGDPWRFFMKQGNDHPGPFEVREVADALDSDDRIGWLIAEDYEAEAESVTFRPYVPPWDPVAELRSLLLGSLLPGPTVTHPSRPPSIRDDATYRIPVQDPWHSVLQDNPVIIALVEPVPEDDPPHTGIYTGRGSHDVAALAVMSFLDHHDMPWREFDETTPQTGSLGDDFDLVWFPGGFSEEYRWYVQGHEQIRDFVSKGGGFIGACAGAYYASASMLWQDGDGSDYPLNLFEGVAIGPIGTPVYWGQPAPLLLTDQPANSGLDPAVNVYYLDGPYFSAGPDQAIEILAQYEANAEAAVISFQYGEGTVLLMGPHPELGYDAEAGVFDVDGGSGAQWPWLHAMFRSLFVP